MRLIGNVEKDAQVRAVASGALPSGDAVVVNSDGTVSVVAGNDAELGSSVVFESAEAGFISSAYDSSNNRVVVAYVDFGDGGVGKVVVGTVSGTSISFGTPVGFNAADGIGSISTVFDSNSNKIVVSYQDAGNSDYGTAVVGTVSGTSISFGTEVVFNSATSRFLYSTFDPTNSKVVIAYRDDGNSLYGTAVVGTVSGTSISFGTPVVFESAQTEEMGMASDTSSGTIVIAYRDVANSSYGTAVVGTVSGTSISFGTPVVHTSESANYNSVVYDSNADKFVLAFRDGSNSNGCVALVATVSGTSISYGTKVVLDSPTSNYISAVFDPSVGAVTVAYTSSSNSNYGTFRSGTVIGTSISFGAAIVFDATNTTLKSVTANDIGGLVFSYQDASNFYYGNAVVYTQESTNLTSENFLGFAAHTYADTQSALVNSTCTVDRNQSGLTAGQTYYVQTDGSLGTTAADPSVVAGTAISSTEIIVKG
jgi:putative methionine-R-sulfoxide reductase with GAF domain